MIKSKKWTVFALLFAANCASNVDVYDDPPGEEGGYGGEGGDAGEAGSTATTSTTTTTSTGPTCVPVGVPCADGDTCCDPAAVCCEDGHCAQDCAPPPPPPPECALACETHGYCVLAPPPGCIADELWQSCQAGGVEDCEQSEACTQHGLCCFLPGGVDGACNSCGEC